jgi:hypothetical protein
LASYVQSTSVVLEEVGKVFEEEGTAPKTLISTMAITTADDVVAKRQGHLRSSTKWLKKSRKNAFGSLELVLMSSRRHRLQTGLEQSKSDLQLLMQIIIYAL